MDDDHDDGGSHMFQPRRFNPLINPVNSRPVVVEEYVFVYKSMQLYIFFFCPFWGIHWLKFPRGLTGLRSLLHLFDSLTI